MQLRNVEMETGISWDTTKCHVGKLSDLHVKLTGHSGIAAVRTCDK